ncbi:MAG: asparagine--tRNA ligase [bacterium]
MTATAIRIADIAGHVGRDVVVRGWVVHHRSSGKIRFLELRDGTGYLQCVMGKADVSPEVFARFDGVSLEASVCVTGSVRADPRSPGGFELGLKDLELIGASADYPISPKEHGVGFLMDERHLWLRSRRQHAMLRVRAEVMRGIREYLDGEGYLPMDAPILTPNACEGTTTLFELQYFERKAYLSQSGQLYNEAAAMAFGKVYCFGPTFRAEKSKTRRHLMEFWMVEPEAAFLDLNGDMALAEGMVAHVVQRVLDRCRADLAVLERDVTKLENVRAPFPRISYDEALEVIRGAGGQIPWGDDFGADEETLLSQAFDKPVLVHRYPAQVKAFYMKRDPARPEVALCVDMIAPEGYGEIVGGGCREESLEALEERIREHGLPVETFKWFLDLRRYGSVPHAGFGLGVERTVAWITGVPHVRETIPFPRLLDRMYP